MQSSKCPFDLKRHTIDIWSVALSCPDDTRAEIESLLDEEERARAAKFRFDHLRHRFVLCRGVLRALVGRYIRVTPCDVRFSCGSQGKPTVANKSEIQFNVSHSETMALFAFAVQCEVGIDIEKVRELTDIAEVANLFFSRQEVEAVMSVPRCDRDHMFFRCWTRKEAYVKAIGGGLSIPLNSFCVMGVSEGCTRLIRTIRDINDLEKYWNLQDLHLDFGFVGALAYHGANRRAVRQFSLINPAEVLSICSK